MTPYTCEPLTKGEIEKTRLPCLFFIFHWEKKVGEGYNLGLIERNGSCQTVREEGK